MHGLECWSALSGYSDPVWGSSLNFSNAWFAQYSVVPDGMEVATLATLDLVVQAVTDHVEYQVRQGIPVARPSRSELLFFISRAILPSTLLGEIKFDATNSNAGVDFMVNQRFAAEHVPVTSSAAVFSDKGVLAPVFPPEAAIVDTVYPMPTWSERVYDPEFCSASAEVAMAILIGIFSAVSIGWMVFVAAMRKSAPIACSSPWFLHLFLLGSVVMYNAIWGWMIYVTTPGCQAMPWLFFLGFGMFAGALLVKNFRIHKIFSEASQNLRHYTLPFPYVVGLLSLILLPILVLLIVWQAVSPLVAVTVVPDIYRPSLNYTICDSDSDSTVFAAILIAYVGTLMLVLSILGIKIWKIDRAIINESLHLALANYSWSLAMIIALAIVASGSVDLEASFLIRSCCLLFGTFFAVNILMIPKVVYIYNGKTLLDVSGTGSSTRGGTGLSSMTSSPRE